MKNKFLRGFAGVLAAAMVVSALPATGLDVDAAAKKVAKGTKITAKPKSVSVVAGSKKTVVISLSKKQSKKFTLKVKSSNAKIATATPKTLTVKKGKTKATKKITIKGVKAGKTTVKVSVKGAKTLSIPVTVTAKKVKLTGVTLNTTSPKAGETLNAKITPANATGVTYVWTLNGTKVGTAAKYTVPETAQAGDKVVVTAKDNSGTTKTAEATVAKAGMQKVEATGAKQLTVTFDSNVSYTPADFTVKKGTATPTVSSVEVSGKTAVITLGSKMTEGTYTVSVDGMSKDVSVEDEKVSAYETVGTTLVNAGAAASGDVTSYTGAGVVNTSNYKARISYKALNQYGEAVADSSTPTVTTSFSGYAAVTADPASGNNFVGTVTVTDITPTLALEGTSGTLLIVNGVSGTKLQQTVTMGKPSTASKLNVVGIYSETDSEYKGITKGDTVTGNYDVIIDVYDQYDQPLTDAANLKTANGIVITLSGGVTGISYIADDIKNITINGEKKLALPLTATTAKSGEFFLTVVNNAYGLLAQETFTVDPGTVVKSVSISQKDMINEGSTAELNYTVTDTAGNSITDFDTLTATTGGVTFTSSDGALSWKKQADGSAKLVFAVSAGSLSNKQSRTSSITIQANETTSSNYYVNTTTLTVYAAKTATSVTAVSSDQATATYGESGTIVLDPANFTVEDQYSNPMTEAEFAHAGLKYDITADGTSGTDGFTDATNQDIGTITTLKNTVTGTAKVKVYVSGKAANGKEFSVAKVSKDAITSISIDEICGGNTIAYTAGTGLVSDGYDGSNALAKGNLVVTGKVGSNTVRIKSTDFDITDMGNKTTLSDTVTSATGTMEVAVDVAPASGAKTLTATKEYTYSNERPVLTTFELKDTFRGTFAKTATSINENANLAWLATNVANITDQYGQDCTTTGDVKVTWTRLTSGAVANLTETLAKNGTTAATLTLSASTNGTYNTSYNAVLTWGSKTIDTDIEFALTDN